MFLMLRLSELEAGSLLVLKYDLGLMDYLSAGLGWGFIPCFISIVPHAPSNCVNAQAVLSPRAV